MLGQTLNQIYWKTAAMNSIKAVPISRSHAPRTATWLTALLLLVFLTVPLTTFLFHRFYMANAPMLPTLRVGDHAFVFKLSYGYSRHSFYGLIPFSGRVFSKEPKRGDVVAFKLPHDDSTDYIRRVIGLPGDTINVRDGVVFINGTEVPRRRIADFVTHEDGGPPRPIPAYEEQLPNGVKYTVLDAEENGPFDNVGFYEVPKGKYFMMGDNRDNSTDSRWYKLDSVPFEKLLGRVAFTVP
jgi:signal peptidase I